MSQTSEGPLRWPETFDGYDTHDKQTAALATDARYKMLEWGRRAGKNITGILELLDYGRAPWRSAWGADDPEHTSVWWVARSYDQAEKYGFLPMLSTLPDAWIDDPQTDVSRSEPYEIHLTNGVDYEFRTYDHPETLQGAGVDKMLVDEADYMADALWYDDLEPMLMDTKGAAMFISKPVRPQSYFQLLSDRGQSSQWADHYYSHATSADNPFIAEDPEDKRGTMPEHKFRQQYLAELPDDGGEVFGDLDATLFTADYALRGEVRDGVGEAYIPPEDATEPFAVGADLARRRDYRVTLALDASGQVVYFRREQNESWGDIQTHLEAIHERYPGVLVPDATRDNKLISDLWNAGVNISPEQFSPQRKRELIENLITAVETGELTATTDGALDQLRTELRILQKEVTPSGYTKYHAPDSGFDDCVDALALAYSQLGDVTTSSATTVSLGQGDDHRSGADLDAHVADQMRQRENGWK